MQNRSFLAILLIISTIVSQDFSYKIYSIRNGVPAKDVFDVTQDSSGKIYFSSFNKIFSYDGFNWEVIHEHTGEEEVRYLKLHYDSKGYLWALPRDINQNIIQFTKDSLKYYPPLSNFKAPFMGIVSFVVKYNSEDKPLIYCGGGNGLYYFKDGKWDKLNFAYSKNETVQNVSLNNDEIHFSTASSVFLLKNGNVKKLFDSPGKKIITHNIENDLEGKTRVWILLEDELGYLQNGEYKLVANSFKNVLVNYNQFGFLNISKKIINWGSLNSMYTYSRETGVVQSLSFYENEFMDEGAHSSFIDKENNIWYVSQRGIYKTRISPFKNYDKNSGLLADEVTAIEFLDDGNLFLGHPDGVSLFNPATDFIKTYSFDFNGNNRVLDAVSDERCNIWFTSQMNGIGKLNKNKTVEWIRTGDIDYYSVLIDDDNTIWFTTSKGLYRLSDNQTPEIKLKVDQKFYNRKLFEASNGGFILCMNDGLFHYKDGEYKHIFSSNNSANNTYTYFNGYKDYELIGTRAGLYEIDSDSLKKFIEGDFQIDSPVYFISKDPSENIWFGLADGVIKWNGSFPTHHRIETGLSGMETNRSAGRAGPNGKFYIGTDDGFSIYDPMFDYNYITFNKLEFVSVEDQNSQKYSLNKQVELTGVHENLLIHFEGYSLIDEEKNLYEFILINNESGEASEYLLKENFISIEKLEPGNYTLKLRLKNGLGQWSDWVTNSNLKIEIPFYSRAEYVYPFLFSMLLGGYFLFSKRKSKKELSPDVFSINEKSYFPEKLLNHFEFSEIHATMLKEKYHRDPNLNINSLAELIKINSRNLSKLLNNELDLTFNSFINLYRIDDAKEMLVDDDYKDYSIEGISKLIGFKSKSSFHKAFKKYTYETPQEFKKKKQFDLQNGVNPY